MTQSNCYVADPCAKKRFEFLVGVTKLQIRMLLAVQFSYSSQDNVKPHLTGVLQSPKQLLIFSRIPIFSVKDVTVSKVSKSSETQPVNNESTL